MKKFTWLYKIKAFYRKHTFLKLFGTAALLAVVALLLWYLPIARVKSGKLPEQNAEEQQESTQLNQDSGEVLAAQSDSKKLYIDTETMNFRVQDIASSTEWNAIRPGNPSELEASLLVLTALGEDNNLYEFNSYLFCTSLKTYEIWTIDHGVRIKMKLGEGESTSFYEYFPLKMPVERFEKFFLSGIEDKKKEGTFSEAKAEKYAQTLKLIYRKKEAENCYAVANNATPPASAIKLLLELAKQLGYSTDMLVEDSEAFGLAVSFKEPASFELVVEAVLDGDDFVITVPASKMVSNNNYYTIQNIQVLPGFGSVAAEEAEEGYIFVPDGAGALFRFNSYRATVPNYSRPIYDNDYYTDYYYMPEYKEELRMPVFGLLNGKEGTADNGFLAIIEQGAYSGYINVKLADATKESGALYNKVYSSFDVTQYHKVKVYGPYSEEAATYLSKAKASETDFKIRYQLFPDEITYYEMAKAYQQYLQKEWGITSLSYEEQPALYLDFIGTLSLNKRFLGIPYESTYSMTTYQELMDILKEQQEKKVVVGYRGVFNGGISNELSNKADLVSANGSKKELKALIEQAENQKADLYLEAALSIVYDSGNGFYAGTHAIHDYSDKPAQIYRYFAPLGILDGYAYDYAKYYYLLSPYYLEYVTNEFLSEAKEYKSLAIPDLTNLVYSDYKFNRGAEASKAAATVEEALKKLSEGKQLTLANPNMDYVKYGAVATDISRESSDCASFYTTIPFRQLVLNGLTKITTENVNMSSKSKEYYILQAVELAAYPKFTLTAKSVDVLKNGPYSWLYSTEYATLEKTISQVYAEIQAAYAEIGSTAIINHYRLRDQVFYTEYEGGVSVITNYNLTPVTVDGYEIEGLSYCLTRQKVR